MTVITVEAVQNILSLGLAPEIGSAHQLGEVMAKYAARVTHPRGNYRYGGYVLNIYDGKLLSVQPMNYRHTICNDCLGTQRVLQFDVEEGEIFIPCQSCVDTRQLAQA